LTRISRRTTFSVLLILVASAAGRADASTPTITAIDPSHGPVGASVTITGAGLADVVGITFGGVPATDFSSVSDSELTATIPSGATTGPIQVETAHGGAMTSADFVVQPNIVLILTDDQRFDEMSMPTVNSELVAKGVTFDNAFVVNPLCCPSRTSILTGRYSHSTDIYSNQPPHGGFATFNGNGEEASTIATWLHAAGYDTALIGKYLNGYFTDDASYVPPGWDTWDAFAGVKRETGFYYDYPMSIDGTVVNYGSADTGDPATTDYSTDRLSWYATQFIESVSPQDPLFLYFSTSAPHGPSKPPVRYRNAPNPCKDHVTPPSYNEADVTDKPPYIQDQALADSPTQTLAKQCRTLLAVDDAVREILGALTDSGRLSNTLLLFMSDNGQTVYEHRWKGKMVPYESSIRVPMVVRYDPVTQLAASTRTRIALNIDVAPTFAEAAGVGAPGAEGASLLPLLHGPVPRWRTNFVVEHANGSDQTVPPYCAVRNSRWKFVRYADGFEELYDLQNDPYELGNLLVTDPTNSAVTARRDLMYKEMLKLCQPLPPGFPP
jgi:N-acetylglucosamine-6-sulfatase